MAKLIYPENLKYFDIISFFTEKNFDILKLREKYKIYMPIQKHTDNVIVLSQNTTPQVADGVITDKKGILIGVKVADCLPILLYDPVIKVIAAVHAGWRSTAKGILKKTVIKMSEIFNCKVSNIIIAMGPHIKGCCYEVGQEVIEALNRETPSLEYVISLNGKKHVDLAIANRIQALSIGINTENIWISSDCTYCNHVHYASYRFHGKKAGRQYGIIGIL
ncbi:MAG: peptidoglycan editing factor PgeF [Thermodesulfovibrio sp.]|nr:peptidoglycan editing factor PgeF [Thermodesulfovibrio sp.]